MYMFSSSFLRKVHTSIVCLVASVEDKHCSNLSNVVIGEHNKLIITKIQIHSITMRIQKYTKLTCDELCSVYNINNHMYLIRIKVVLFFQLSRIFCTFGHF